MPSLLQRIAVFSRLAKFLAQSIYPHREEGTVRKDEKRAPVGPAKYEIDWPLRDVDFGNLLACWVIDEDLSIRNVDIALSVDRDTLATALHKPLQIPQCPIEIDSRAVRPVF